MKAAVANGLLKPRMDSEAYLGAWNSMRNVLQAGLEAEALQATARNGTS